MMIKVFSKILFTGLLFLSLFVSFADAEGIKNNNFFTVSPVKVEAFIGSGETIYKNLTIKNQTKDRLIFKVSIEKFKGSKNTSSPIILSGNSILYDDYIKPKTNIFTIDAGKKVILPVRLSMPKNINEKGLYYAVLISAFSEDKMSGTNIVSRVGSLFFIKPKGDYKENGSLVDFKLLGNDKVFFNNIGPLGFEFLFKNEGDVYVNPYGKIEIKNIFGKVIDTLNVEPYFSMPDSIRYKDIYRNNKETSLGLYTATIFLNKGYDDLEDVKTIYFWVIPIKYLFFISMFLLFLIFVSYNKLRKNR